MISQVVILGAGVGGCGTALELADAGYQVTLIEMLDELLAGTSQRMPCRLGLGFHYIDIPTAIKNLHAVLALMKKYPGFRLGEDYTDEHRLRRGRYLVVKDSQFSADTILHTYNELKATYAQLCEEDPSNEVFGPAENFFRILDPTEYSEASENVNVVLGIETAECILNWPKIKAYITHKILQHPRITTHINTEVTKIQTHTDNKYLIGCKQPDKHIALNADVVVNCTWHNIEKLNSQLGLKQTPRPRTQRLKAMVEITVPDELLNKPSSLFCFGPHAAFTNLGNGRGFLTYEPVTNVEKSTEISLPTHIKNFMSPQLRNQVSANKIGEKIIIGAAKYLPALAEAKLLNVHFGIVRSFGNANIFSRESSIHERRESGVEQLAPRWIVNGCMKLTYFVLNAQEVLQLVQNIEVSQTSIMAPISNQFDICAQSEDTRFAHTA